VQQASIPSRADSPAGLFDHDAHAVEREPSRRALDELFEAARLYQSSREYCQLLSFVRRFRSYSPFNAMLVHLQLPGAQFVAPADRWKRQFGRAIKPGARPLVILKPRGPVMFVFDVSDTFGAPLPREVERPFEVRGRMIGGALDRVILNCARDGIRVTTVKLGSQEAGSIRWANGPALAFGDSAVPQRYLVELNGDHSREARFATLAHELAHLYCGHIGTPNPDWWPARRHLPEEIAEFEAESAAYLVCARLGIDAGSDRYLARYLASHEDVPPISLDAVMRSAGWIERMTREKLRVRREE
jgi:hypothetical protein